ncbi:DUF1697 domain-containing protein [Yoonia sp. 2307UL14-13]|uniref:DUF1697 domain-containing protein n=1 Tax=Yoonia sp. 2307UL14-13 TaxID=3126506 RepID=UPI00309F7968
MAKWVAFLRGINVGGHRKVPMMDLRRIVAERLSGQDVCTYIASGNVVFEAEGRADDIAKMLQSGMAEVFGFVVPVLVLNDKMMRGVLDSCPFPRDAGKAVHAYLCHGPPQLDQAGVDAMRAPNEQVAVNGQTVWLYAPDGIGRSKLAAKMERLLGVEATARNLNTVAKMVEMSNS